MATSAVVATGLLPSSGTVDITVSGFGTPTAAIIFVSNAGDTTNPSTNGHLGVGFWASTAQMSTGIGIGDGLATTNTGRKANSAAAISFPSTSGSSQLLGFTAAATTDGLTFTAVNAATTIYATVILIKGTTNAYCNLLNLGTSTAAQGITAPGFKPDVLVVASIGHNADSTGLDHAILSFGVAHNNSSNVVSQGMAMVTSTDAAAATASSVYVDNAAVCGQLFADSLSWKAAINSMDTNGFTIDATASAGSDRIYYLALKLADPDDAYVGVIDSKASTGTQTYTGTGFTPQVVAIAQTMATAVQTVTQNGSLALGAADGTRQRCVDITDSDAADPTAAGSRADLSNIVHLQDDGETDDTVASLSSMDSNGFTLNYSDGSASVRKWLAFAFGDSTAGGGAPTLSDIKATNITATTVQGTYDYAF